MKAADFLGRWRLDRVIEDARAGQRITLSGEAVFTPDGAGLRYDETGRLTLPGQPPVEARQTRFWEPTETGFAVFFEDGRPFHALRPEGVDEVHHDCPPDDYRGRYDFTQWPLWSMRWQVRGPRKDYVSSSLYSRIGPSEPGDDMG